MDRKIKLLAVTSVAAITTAACTPQGGANAPHNQQTAGTSYTGSTTSPVTHSHSGKVHAHLLPATGIRHTHTTGSGATGGSTNTQPTTTYQPPANTGSSGNNGLTHSHSGKVHTHRLPTTGINHTHRVGGGSAPTPVQPRPPVATGSSHNQAATRRDPNAHSHNGRVHSHRLPATGLNHGHNTGAGTPPRPPVANNYRPPAPATNTYRPPANTYRPPAGNNSGGVAHKHNGRAHSHRLPASGMNHGHNAGATNRPVAPQTNRPAPPQTNTNSSSSSYYDYSNNTTTAPPRTNNTAKPAANTGNSSYYDYSSGSSSTYYNTAKPKASPNTSSNNSYYDYSAPSSSGSSTASNTSSSSASAGSFAPNNYSGGNAYTVQRGDTVFQVMRNTGVYWKDIIRMNNLKAPNYKIVPGQRLKLR